MKYVELPHSEKYRHFYIVPVFTRRIFSMLQDNSELTLSKVLCNAPYQVNRLRLQGVFLLLTHALVLMVRPYVNTSEGVVKFIL